MKLANLTPQQQQKCITLPSGQRCLPTPYTYIFQLSLATANLTLLNNVMTLDTDSDFFLHAIFGIGSNVNVRIQDANTYYLSNNLLPIAFYQPVNNPQGQVQDPDIFFPLGSRILIDAQDVSGTANNAFKLMFRGTKNIYVN